MAVKPQKGIIQLMLFTLMANGYGLMTHQWLQLAPAKCCTTRLMFSSINNYKDKKFHPKILQNECGVNMKVWRQFKWNGFHKLLLPPSSRVPPNLDVLIGRELLYWLGSTTDNLWEFCHLILIFFVIFMLCYFCQPGDWKCLCGYSAFCMVHALMQVCEIDSVR